MDEADRLQRLVDRERRARQNAEAVAEGTIRTLYERQRDILLLREVAFAANAAGSIVDALASAVTLVCRHGNWPVGHAWILGADGALTSTGVWHDASGGRFELLKQRTERLSFRPGIGLPGQVLARAQPVWVDDVSVDANFPRNAGGGDLGLHSAFGVPVLVGHNVMAVMEFFHEEPAPPDAHLLELMSQIGAVLGRVIERERARAELADANAQLTRALTDLRTAQEDMVRQERLRALGQMASGIAHDFNNALTPIRAYTEMLDEFPEIRANEEAHQFIQTILTAASDAAAMVGRLREFYRPVSEVDTEGPVDLSRIARQAMELTRPRWHNEARLRGVELEVDSDLPTVPSIVGHAPQLRAAMTNLIFNAVDAMPNGGRLRVATRATDTEVTVSVTDSGTGMTEEVQRQCLEPFFTTKGDQGSGLGLPMVYGIAQRHHGTFTIDSAAGRGTTVKLTFPVAAAVAAAAPEPLPVPARAASAGLRVLVVDDAPAARDLLKNYLTGDGHVVTMAVDGVDAMDRLRESDFDVVVTDRTMPRMNGLELAAAVKQQPRPLPVIMATGVGQMMLDSSEWPAGVDLVLPNPVAREGLRAALAALCPDEPAPAVS